MMKDEDCSVMSTSSDNVVQSLCDTKRTWIVYIYQVEEARKLKQNEKKKITESITT